MGECMLDSYGEDDFQSSEGFDDWSGFSSANWAVPQQDDNSFSDWSGFQENTGKEEESSKTETSELPNQAESLYCTGNSNQVNVQFAFHDCFHDDGPMKEPLMLEIPTLSQLLQSKRDLPSQSAGISSEASKFWHHLQSEPEVLRLSDPKHKLHSHEMLLKTLQITQPDASAASQSTTHSDSVLDKPDHSSALIQTKLIAPSSCRNAPGFFYQISRHWLSQHRTNLLPSQPKKH